MAWFGDSKKGRIGTFFGNRPTLVGYWQLDGSSKDNLGGSNVGSDSNVVYGILSRLGKAARFNGSTSEIDLGTTGLPTGSAAGTFLAWCYWIDTGSDVCLTMYGGATRTTANERALIFTNSNRSLYFFGAANDAESSFQFISKNQWHLVGYSYAAGDTAVTLILDNKFQKISFSGGLPLNTPSSSVVNYLGRVDDGSDRFGGSIEEVAMFSEALSTQLIQQYYAWAQLKRRSTWLRMLFVPLNALTRSLSDSIMVAASRTVVLTRLASYLRSLSDSIMNAASRFATIFKGTTGKLTVSIMNAASRFAIVHLIYSKFGFDRGYSVMRSNQQTSDPTLHDITPDKMRSTEQTSVLGMDDARVL